MIIIECQIGERGSQPLLPQLRLVAGLGLEARGVRVWFLTKGAQPDGAVTSQSAGLARMILKGTSQW